MAESLHGNLSPYAVDAENKIIDKKLTKWEPVLAILALCAILLPAAAEANLNFLIGISFLALRRFRLIKALSPAVKSVLGLLFKGCLILWVSRLFLWITAWIESGESAFSLNMRLLGKQGLYGFMIILFFLAMSQMRPKNKDFPWARALLIFSASVAFYALLQRYWGFDFVHGLNARLGTNRFAYGVYRASAWMGHPLTLAYNALLLGVICFAQARYLWGKVEAWLWLGIAALSGVILLLSQSRFPLLIFAAIVLGQVFFLLRARYRVGLLIGLAGLCALAYTFAGQLLGRWSELFNPNIPLEQRFDRLLFWKAHWQLFLDHPWTGTGLGAYEGRLLDTYAQAGYTGLERKYNAHNIFLQTLADSGLMGGAALLLMLGALGLCAIQVKKRFGHSGLLFVFLVTVIGGLAQNNLRDSEYLFALWTSIGLVLYWLSDQGNGVDESTGREQSEDRQP